MALEAMVAMERMQAMESMQALVMPMEAMTFESSMHSCLCFKCMVLALNFNLYLKYCGFKFEFEMLLIMCVVMLQSFNYSVIMCVVMLLIIVGAVEPSTFKICY